MALQKVDQKVDPTAVRRVVQRAPQKVDQKGHPTAVQRVGRMVR